MASPARKSCLVTSISSGRFQTMAPGDRRAWALPGWCTWKGARPGPQTHPLHPPLPASSPFWPPPPLLILPGKLLPGAPGPLLDRLAPKDPPSPTASQLGTPASSVPGVEDSCSPDSEPMLSAHPPRLPPLGDAGRPSANARCWGRKWLKVPPDRLVICWAGAVSPASCAHREKGGGRGPQAVISPLLLQIT